MIADGKAANLNTGSVPNNLTKSGTGTITLTGQCTHTGTNTVTAGVLKLNRTGGNTLPSTSSVTVNGGSLQISTDQTLNSITLTSGTLIIDPGVTLTQVRSPAAEPLQAHPLPA